MDRDVLETATVSGSRHLDSISGEPTEVQALRMFTIGPAYAAFDEADKGSIEPGKPADLTVLNADIMKIPEPEIPKTRCAMTIVGGELVYQAEIP